MVETHKLHLLSDCAPIEVSYHESEFPTIDTCIVKYAAYKLNIMLTDGLAAVIHEREVRNTIKGDVLLFHPDETHFGRVLRSGCHKYIELLIPVDIFKSFSGQFKQIDLFLNTSKNKMQNKISPSPETRVDLLNIAKNIIQNFNNDALLFSYILQFLNICVDTFMHPENTPEDKTYPPFIEETIKYINEHFSDNVLLSDISTHTGCSSSYLERIFRKYIGKTVYEYLTEYRLFNSIKLLKEGCNVTEAASRSGFADSSTFIKSFKKKFNVTPGKYQKSSL